jgi:hypothetical protein
MLRAICGGATVLLVCCVTACGPLLGSVFSEPVPASQKLPQSLFTLLDDGDMPDGVNYRPNQYEAFDSRNSADAVDSWKSVHGTPLECYGVWAAEYLSVYGVGHDDDLIVGIGYFEYDYDKQGRVWAAARVFRDAASSAAFIDGLRAAAEECPTGYQWDSDDEGSTWYVDSVHFSDAKTVKVPSGVSASALDQSTTFANYDLHDTFLRRDRVVVLLSCEIKEFSPFDAEGCDALTGTIAERLAALTF